MEWRMSERSTAASSDVNRLLGDRITAATIQTETQHGQDGHADAQRGIDVAQVVPAHGDVAPGADDAAGRPEGTGGEEDQRRPRGPSG